MNAMVRLFVLGEFDLVGGFVCTTLDSALGSIGGSNCSNPECILGLVHLLCILLLVTVTPRLE